MDAYIVNFVRPVIGRFGAALAGKRADDLGAITIKALMERHPEMDWTKMDEVIFGCANQAGDDNRNVAPHGLISARNAP